MIGKAGSYLSLSTRSGGSVITASFLRVSLYNGTTTSPPLPGANCNANEPGGTNNRTCAAVEWGPILLAAVASDYAKSHRANCSVGAAHIDDLRIQGSFTIQGIDTSSSKPASWLTPSATPLAPHAFSLMCVAIHV